MGLPPLAGAQEESWAALLDVAPSLGQNWLLVGGQMVLLHEVERRSSQVRPTDDVDVVVDLRVEPAGLARVHAALGAAGFVQDEPGPDGMAHRFRRASALIDVLAPDHLGRRVKLTIGIGRTVEAPGTSQAFRRSEWRHVRLAGPNTTATVRRPTLVGAIIAKAAATLQVTSQDSASRAKHQRDVDALASLAGPADRDEARLTRSEVRLVQRILDETLLSSVARASLRLFLHPSDRD